MGWDQIVDLFAFQTPLWEIVLRGTAVYWFLFLLLRVFQRREVGSVAVSDVLLLVLIADAVQNAMAGDYRTIGDGCVLVATLWGWSMLFDWLSYRLAWLNRWLSPPPLKLVQDGRMLRQNMRKEWLTREELMSQLREHGVAELSEVRQVFMENDGKLSVIKKANA